MLFKGWNLKFGFLIGLRFAPKPVESSVCLFTYLCEKMVRRCTSDDCDACNESIVLKNMARGKTVGMPVFFVFSLS
jgi:hypothetical protein